MSNPKHETHGRSAESLLSPVVGPRASTGTDESALVESEVESVRKPVKKVAVEPHAIELYNFLRTAVEWCSCSHQANAIASSAEKGSKPVIACRQCASMRALLMKIEKHG